MEEIKSHKRPSRIPEDKPDRKMCQTVWITFSDGKKAGFFGEAAVFTDQAVEIVDIAFTKPRPLPRGCEFKNANDL